MGEEGAGGSDRTPFQRLQWEVLKTVGSVPCRSLQLCSGGEEQRTFKIEVLGVLN